MHSPMIHTSLLSGRDRNRPLHVRLHRDWYKTHRGTSQPRIGSRRAPSEGRTNSEGGGARREEDPPGRRHIAVLFGPGLLELPDRAVHLARVPEEHRLTPTHTSHSDQQAGFTLKKTFELFLHSHLAGAPESSALMTIFEPC